MTAKPKRLKNLDELQKGIVCDRTACDRDATHAMELELSGYDIPDSCPLVVYMCREHTEEAMIECHVDKALMEAGLR